MITIEPALFDARDRALPGREAAALNELCRQIVELMRRPPNPANGCREAPASHWVCGAIQRRARV
jgi:hypothetical protein